MSVIVIFVLGPGVTVTGGAPALYARLFATTSRWTTPPFTEYVRVNWHLPLDRATEYTALYVPNPCGVVTLTVTNSSFALGPTGFHEEELSSQHWTTCWGSGQPEGLVTPVARLYRDGHD